MMPFDLQQQQQQQQQPQSVASGKNLSYMRQIAVDESRQPTAPIQIPARAYSPVSEGDEEEALEDLLQAAVNDTGIQSGVTIAGEFVPCRLSDDEFQEFLGDVTAWRALSSSGGRSVSCIQRGRFLGTLAKLLFAKSPTSTRDLLAVERELGRKLRRVARRVANEVPS